jgi:hypothetical protein
VEFFPIFRAFYLQITGNPANSVVGVEFTKSLVAQALSGPH